MRQSYYTGIQTKAENSLKWPDPSSDLYVKLPLYQF